MIAKKYWKMYYEDNLVLRVKTHDRKIFSQGKRLPNKASKLTKRIQKAYVKGDVISAIKIIRKEVCSSLKDSLSTFNELRGKDNRSGYWTTKGCN